MVGVVGVTDGLERERGDTVGEGELQRGERIDAYRGTALTQAEALASASGIGDVILRVKHNSIRRGASGLAFAAEVRLPTGDPDNLLGAGETVFVPRLIGSYESNRIGVHANMGYAFSDLPDEFDWPARSPWSRLSG